MATNISHGGHGHETEFVPTGPTHDLGYEPDKFAVKTILIVPAAVIITAFLAFVVTWVIFANVFSPKINNPVPESSVAAERNAAPLNDRFSRISSTEPNAEVTQPRLEGLNKTQVYYRDGNPNNKDPNNLITAEMIPTLPTKDGNSPRLHAEDLRANRIKELSTFGEDKQAGTTRMPVDQAIKMAVGGGLLPAQSGAQPLAVEPHWDRPKDSNGGHGKSPESTTVPVAPKKAAEDKKEPEKKGEPAEKK